MQCIIGHEIWVMGQGDNMRFGTCSGTHGMLIFITLPIFLNQWSVDAKVRYAFWVQIKVKVKWSRYRPDVAQTVSRGIALLFHDRGTRRRWVVSSRPRQHFTLGKDPVPILQETEWDPGPVWAGGKSRPHRDSIPDRPDRSQSLYWLSYPAHFWVQIYLKNVQGKRA